MIRLGHDRRLEPRARTVDALAAQEQPSALGARILDLPLEEGDLGRPREGADERVRVQGIPDDIASDRLHERVQETVVDLGVHVHALDGAAALARVVEGAFRDGGRGRLHVHVVGDVHRVLAPQLEVQPDEPAPRLRRDAPARRVGATRPASPPPSTGAKTAGGTPAACSASAMARPVRVANSEGL